MFAGYEVISGRIQSFQPIWEITVCIVIGVVSQGLIKYDFCFTPVAFSAFIVVLPGYGMAIAIQELVSRQLVSGVVRMVYAIIYSFLLGYGVSMGSELYQTGDTTPYAASDHCKTATSSTMPMASESQWFNFLTVPLFALGYCLYVRAKPHRWPTMTFVAACGFVVNYSLNRWAHAPSQILQVVPSFVLGMLGNLLTKFTGKMSFDAVLLGVSKDWKGADNKGLSRFFGRSFTNCQVVWASRLLSGCLETPQAKWARKAQDLPWL